MSLRNIQQYLLLALVFLLPWQTRWIYAPGFLSGGAWEYGSLSLYGTEILLWFILFLTAVELLRNKEVRARISNKEHFKSHWPRLVGAGLVLLFCGIQILFSPLPNVSYQTMLWVLGGACIAVIIRLHSSIREKLVGAFWFSGVVQGVFALWQFVTQHIPANKWLGLAYQIPYAHQGESVVEFIGTRWLRAYGSFPSPNILGSFLAVALIMGIVLYLKTHDWRLKVVITIGQLVMTVGLLLSFSRSAWLALVSGLIMLGVLFFVERKTIERSTVYAFVKQTVMISIVGVLVVLVLRPLFFTRINVQERLEVGSVSERVEQYHTWSGIMKEQWLWGVGPGMYTHTLFEQQSDWPFWKLQPMHNTYFLIFAELGIVGGVGVSGALVYLLHYVWRRQRWALPIVVVILVSALFDHFWWSLYIGIVLASISISLSFPASTSESSRPF